MLKCQYCGKEVEELETLEIYINDEHIGDQQACPSCAATLKAVAEDPNFGNILMGYIRDLESNWELGTKENAKVGSIVKIVHLAEEPNDDYCGKTGVIESIDDAGQLHGTWGGLAVIPECDKFLVLKD